MKLFRNKHDALFFLVRFEDVPSATGAVPCAVLRFFYAAWAGEVSVPVDAFRENFSAAEEPACTPPTLDDE